MTTAASDSAALDAFRDEADYRAGHRFSDAANADRQLTAHGRAAASS